MTGRTPAARYIDAQSAEVGKTVKLKDGFLSRCTCWQRPPHKRAGGNDFLGQRYEFTAATLDESLDNWAVHIADSHPDVAAPCLARLETGARDRVRVRAERAAAEIRRGRAIVGL